MSEVPSESTEKAGPGTTTVQTRHCTFAKLSKDDYTPDTTNRSTNKTTTRNVRSQTMSNAVATETTLSVPEGYTLNFDSTEPVWFGPEFESSWAQWDFNGIKAFIVAGNFAECMTIDQAKEVHRQIEGILTLMGELPV